MAADGSLQYRVDDREARNALALVLHKQDPILSRALHDVGQLVRDEAKHRAPVGHPHRSKGMTLVQSILYKVLANRVIVRSNKRYAAIQEFGGTTGPHTIRARRAGALAFNGQIYKSVAHPGATIKARHYMFGALEAKQREVDNTIERAVDESMKGLV